MGNVEFGSGEYAEIYIPLDVLQLFGGKSQLSRFKIAEEEDHQAHRMSLEAGKTKPVKQTRQIVTTY